MSRLEDDLATMLRTRSRDIQMPPADLTRRAAAEAHNLGPRGSFAAAERRGRTHTGWLAAAAVAAVLVLVGGLAAYSHFRGSSRRTPPAVTPTVVRTTTLTQCRVALPAAWQAAVSSATNPFAQTSQTGDIPLAVLADGSSVISRGTLASGYDVLQISPSGSTRTLLAVPAGEQLMPQGAIVTGNRLVVWLSGQNVTGYVLALSVIDLGSGSRTRQITIQTLAQSLRAGAPSTYWVAATNGQVFWDTRQPDGNGTITREDLTTGARTIVYSGAAEHPLQSAAGVYFVVRNGADGAHIDVAATGVPAAVLAATSAAARLTMSTDGRHWAWFDAAAHRIGWFDGTQIRYVSAPASGLPLQEDSVGATSVAGDVVLFFAAGSSRGTQVVLDMRTGATASLPASDNIVDTNASVALGYGDGGGRSAHPLLRFDTAVLPTLYC